jgi:hypothetical protein
MKAVLVSVVVTLFFVATVAAQWSPVSPPGSTTGVIYYNGGPVAIGAASAQEALEVTGAVKVIGYTHYVLANSASLDYSSYQGNGGRIVVFGANTSTPATFTLHLASSNGQVWNDAVYVASSGNVGINTINPTYKLDVNGTGHVSGDLTVDGNLAAKFQDVAEWVPATSKLSAGTVVVLNPNRENEVMASSHPYDMGVAGVVSANPGIVLGEPSNNKAKIATTGRVKVLVDAGKRAIHIGDLLVTSDKAGMAMKSEPLDLAGVKIHRPGTLIGKALEPLASGQGEILVLLSLQ